MISLKSYSPELIEHFNNTQYVGHFDEKDPTVGTGTAGCAESGDLVRIQVKLKGQKIEAICFKALGSCATIGVASWLCQRLEHQPLSQIQSLTPEAILKELKLLPVRKHSVLLVLDALAKATQYS